MVGRKFLVVASTTDNPGLLYGESRSYFVQIPLTYFHPLHACLCMFHTWFLTIYLVLNFADMCKMQGCNRTPKHGKCTWEGVLIFKGVENLVWLKVGRFFQNVKTKSQSENKVRKKCTDFENENKRGTRQISTLLQRDSSLNPPSNPIPCHALWGVWEVSHIINTGGGTETKNLKNKSMLDRVPLHSVYPLQYSSVVVPWGRVGRNKHRTLTQRPTRNPRVLTSRRPNFQG